LVCGEVTTHFIFSKEKHLNKRISIELSQANFKSKLQIVDINSIQGSL